MFAPVINLISSLLTAHWIRNKLKIMNAQREAKQRHCRLISSVRSHTHRHTKIFQAIWTNSFGNPTHESPCRCDACYISGGSMSLFEMPHCLPSCQVSEVHLCHYKPPCPVAYIIWHEQSKHGLLSTKQTCHKTDLCLHLGLEINACLHSINLASTCLSSDIHLNPAESALQL